MKQDTALEVMKTGVNVFLTGEPGAGKTHTINQYVDWLRERGVSVAVTASTGIAASHLNGQTIHSWSGIGINDTLDQDALDRIMRKGKSARRISDTAVLVIDEISMLNGTILDTLDHLFRTVRMDMRAFGGMQVLCVGDFFQLPPVADDGTPYAFESEVWERAEMRVCYLTEQYRQEDSVFLELLRSIRGGSAGERERTLLEEQNSIAYADREPTFLHAKNYDVDRDNAARLDDLSGDEKSFVMQRVGPDALTDQLVKSCLSPEVLCLKEGAAIMCTKNNPERGFFNGTLGTVALFDSKTGVPVIKTFDGRWVTIEEMEWSIMDGEEKIASVKQLPLRLAWALTIHKSQGSSLDAAEINLSDVFVAGQGYVALSRVRTLGGLKVTGAVNPMALQVSPAVSKQDIKFRESSDVLLSWCERYPASLQKKQQDFLDALGISGEPAPGGGAVRVKQKHTLEMTKEMLSDGLSVREIAKQRDLKPKTILGHVEKLAADGKIVKNDISHLLPDGWSDIFNEVSQSFEKVGIENLFPVHSDLKGKRSYDTLKLARAWYRLGGSKS